MAQANPPALYEQPSLAAQSPSMFQGASGFGIRESRLVNVQGDMIVHPSVPLPVPSGPQQGWQVPQTTVLNIPSPPRRTAVYSESGNYTEQLLGQGRGFPLYVPKPQRNLPAEYRRKGVAIGDVGTITPEGIFDFFFNIFLPPDDPINANTPEGFVPLAPYHPIDLIHNDIDPGDYVSSPSIHEIGDDFSEPETGGDFVFDCQGPNGAVLALPHGARVEKLRNLENMRRHAATHAESWYKYANETRGRGLVNGSLYLVTGCEKARSWGMASFHDVSLPGENGFPLSFRPTTDANNGYRYRWKGPYCRRKQADSDGTRLNQTTFIHAFTISLGETIWGRFFGGVKVSPLADSSAFPTMSGHGFVPYGSQGTSFILSFFGGNASGGGKQCAAGAPAYENAIISDASPISPVFHPSQIIHDRLLREFPQAAVMITHDDDWREIFRDDDIRMSGQSYSVLQQAIFDRCETMEENGAVFLRTKSEFIQGGSGAMLSTQNIDLPTPASSGETENRLHVSSAEELTLLASSLELTLKAGRAEEETNAPIPIMASSLGEITTNAAPTRPPPQPSSSYHPPRATAAAQRSKAKRQHVPEPVTTDQKDDDVDGEMEEEGGARAKPPGSCARCKNLKVKCEFKTESDPCKRCFNGGHDCVTPGRKKRRTPPKREHLLNQIREQAAEIQKLMTQLEETNARVARPPNSAATDIFPLTPSSSGREVPSPVPSPSVVPSSSYFPQTSDADTKAESENNRAVEDWIAEARDSLADSRPQRDQLREKIKYATALDDPDATLSMANLTCTYSKLHDDEHPTFGGGFGDVYRTSFQGSTVALKRIRTFNTDSITHRNRLQKEVLVWQSLRHPPILPFLGIDCSTFASPFPLVSPWLVNGNVFNNLQHHGREDMNGLLLDLAQGLEYLHGRNIDHGDLRAANILVSNDWNARLADFGLATILDATSSCSTARAGSPRWLAPELADRSIPDFGLSVILNATSLGSTVRAGSARWLAPELISFGCGNSKKREASDTYAFASACLEIFSNIQFADLPCAGEAEATPWSRTSSEHPDTWIANLTVTYYQLGRYQERLHLGGATRGIANAVNPRDFGSRERNASIGQVSRGAGRVTRVHKTGQRRRETKPLSMNEEEADEEERDGGGPDGDGEDDAER